MHWAWSVSGFALIDILHEQIRYICRHAGLAGIEVAPPLFDGMGESDLKIIASDHRADGLNSETSPFDHGPDFSDDAWKVLVEDTQALTGRTR
jgi:hypothetical protein